MGLVVPNSGELELLRKMLKDALSTDESYTLKLFNNNYTPVNSSISSDFTTPTFTNYANKTLSRGGWATPSIVSSKGSSDYGTTQSWTCGASGDSVYGYFVIGTSSAICLWAERFSSVRTLANSDILNITPSFTINSETNG